MSLLPLNTLIEDFLYELKKNFAGDLRIDKTTRLLYSTDASIYEIEPLGVAFPKTGDDLAVAVETCARYKVPVLARGAGSSLAGQAIGPALILDCSRYLTRIIQIDHDARTAEVEPGVILSDLNREAAKSGLRFGPDPASADRATIGGCLANNATGAHSILYGMSADHLLAADVVLADGSQATLKSLPIEDALRVAGRVGGEMGSGAAIETQMYRAAFTMREHYSREIKLNWPRTWRCASGYNLPYLLPWAPSAPPRFIFEGPYPPLPPGNLNLAPLLAGSEGTLGIIQHAKVRLVPQPGGSILVVLPFLELEEACASVPGILERGPSAIELIPQALVRLAKTIPAYARQLSFVDQLTVRGKEPESLLVVEFYGDNPGLLEHKAASLGNNSYIARTSEMQKKVWEVRNVGLGILNSTPGDEKAISLIEDLSVPVERLPEFVRELTRILGSYGFPVQLYAHASAGCLHGRFLMDLKSKEGVRAMRAIAAEAVEMTLNLGGAVSGEHGDGLARGEWLEKEFGQELVQAFRMLKEAVDPENILNPGKIVDVQPMDSNLRFGTDYRARAWAPILNFSNSGNAPGEAGLLMAVEHCNGAGVCRKSGGVMCPSFQVLKDEKHSTRGRANLMRALISGRFPSDVIGEKAVKEALDLCLACKGCKAECPSGVDLAKLKFEFMHHYYESHRRPSRDYLFGYVNELLKMGAPLASLLNMIFASRIFRRIGAMFFGLAYQRRLPLYTRYSLDDMLKSLPAPEPGAEPVLVMLDAYNRYFYPENCRATMRALIESGCHPIQLPIDSAGRSLLSKGLLEAARIQARRVLSAVRECDPKEVLPLVGIEPSEIYTLRDEFLDLITSGSERTEVERLASRTYSIEEFLVRPGKQGEIRLMRIANNPHPNKLIKTQSYDEKQPKVLLHTHCYQKTQPPSEDGYPNGGGATVEMLIAMGYSVSVIDSGCCGMAGSFGYESEHYDLSMSVGEDRLFPAVRAAGEGVIIATGGVSCHSQIQDGTGRKAVHPIRLLFPRNEDFRTAERQCEQAVER